MGYVLWGRIEQIGPTEFFAIVTAVPADVAGQAHVIDAVLSSREIALGFLTESVLRLGSILREAGGVVLDVEIE